MKNILNSKDEKITEKAFSRSLLVSILSIFLCLVVLCSMTYAWFTSGISSSSNKIVSGSFDFDVSVTKLTDNTSTASIITPIETDENQGVFTYKLSAGTYTVVLDLNNDCTAKGYGIIKIGSVEKQTDVLVGENTANREGYEQNDVFEFTLVVEEDDTIVEFIKHWGVGANFSITKDRTYSTDDWENASEESTGETDA